MGKMKEIYMEMLERYGEEVEMTEDLLTEYLIEKGKISREEVEKRYSVDCGNPCTLDEILAIPENAECISAEEVEGLKNLKLNETMYFGLGAGIQRVK